MSAFECSGCFKDASATGHDIGCREIGLWYDLLCPGCGGWGGNHATYPGNATCTAKCVWGVTASRPSTAAGPVVKAFGRWGYFNSSGVQFTSCYPAKVQSANPNQAVALPAPVMEVTTPFTGEQPKAKRLCECGSHATGAADHTPSHSTWCPAFSAAFKRQPDDLVAMVRSTPKKLRP